MRNLLVLGLVGVLIAGAVYLFLSKDDRSEDGHNHEHEEALLYIDTESRSIPTPANDIIDATGLVTFYTINDRPTGAAGVHMGFSENGGYPTLNVAFDFNNDGEYAAYETENGKQEEWLLKNVPAYILADQDAVYEVAVVDTNIYGKERFVAAATFSEAPLSETWLTEPSRNTKEILFAADKFELADILGLNVPGAGPGVYRGAASFGDFVSVAHAAGGPEVPDLDVDLSLDIPDLSQSSMECAPTSITNNMLGLAGAHNAADKLPPAEQMIAMLKEDLRFGDDGIDGVLDRNYIEGKNAFMRRFNLPVITTEIDNPSFDDIADALTNGSVVEMDLAFFDVSGGSPQHVASHVVTVTGGTSDGGEFTLRGRDSATPEGHESWQFFPKYEGQARSQLYYPKWKDGATIVNKIYVQTWVGIDEAIAAGVLPPGIEGSTYPVEMLKIGSSYYPKKQFISAGPDKCDSYHYHKRSDAVGLAAADSTSIVHTPDPTPDGCGYGKISEVPVETLRITWQQQQALAGALSNP